jgi:hypothetical protein
MVQDKQVYISNETSKWQKLLWLGKLVVTLLILAYIYRTFKNEQKGVQDVGKVFWTMLTTGNHAWVFILVLVLVPINWALESLKWQRLARRVVNLSFADAFRGTLSGLAIGVAAPAP